MPEPSSEPRDTNYPNAIKDDSNDEDIHHDQHSEANSDHSNLKLGQNSLDNISVPFFKYVLVGGGMASYYAMKTIKKMDTNAQILIIGQEPTVPYSRPPLSKELWDSSEEDLENWMFKDYSGDRKSVFYDTKSFITVKETNDFTSSDKVCFLNGSVSSIDTAEESVKLSNGAKIRYGKLLIATGGSPKILPTVKDLPKESRDRVLTFRGVSIYIFKINRLMILRNCIKFRIMVIRRLQLLEEAF